MSEVQWYDEKLPTSLAVLGESSLSQCSALCEHEPECISVNYNNAKRQCELSDEYPEIAFNVAESNGQTADWAVYYKPNPFKLEFNAPRNSYDRMRHVHVVVCITIVPGKNQYRTPNLPCEFIYTVHIASETVGTITSPNYPNNYNNNADRKWLVVKPSKTSTLYLDFHDVNVGRNPCGDLISIYDGACTDAPLCTTLCGTATKLIIHDSGKYVLITLTTDSTAPFSGFSMNYYVSQ